MTGADPTPTIAPRQAANETESESKSTATSEIGTSSYITMSITQTPTPAQTATAGAQTHTYDPNEYGWDVFLVPMSKKEPVFVIDLPEDLTAASVVFNVAADGADFQLPRIIAWAGPSGSEPYYFPGSNYPDPASGGTPAGGYNRRREDTWEVLWDQGFANWTYGFTLNNGVTEGAPPVKSQILMGLGLGPDGDVLYEPDTIGNVPIKVYVEITTNGE
jgi:hypothetical protein